MLDKKGFSLIEIIICIAIIGVLATGSMGFYSMIKYADTKKCAGSLNAALEKARMNTMARTGSPSLYIYKKNNNYYYKLTDEASFVASGGTLFANNNITVSYVKKGLAAGSETEITSGSPLKLKFLKSTGGFTNADGALICDSILVKGGSDYVIKLVEKTGKHYIES